MVLREYWLFPWRAVPVILRLVLKIYEDILLKKGIPGFLLLVVSLIVFWHIYVPLHELFHVFGCWITGGHVAELALKPQYGGTLLQPLFPFIVTDSNYAGQLTGFTTPNDLAYVVVDLFPYLLSLPGLALFVLAGRKLSPVLFGLATVLSLTPIFSIPGDFYEAVSLGFARIAALIDPQLDPRTLVSDDIFTLIPQLSEAGLLQSIPLIFLVLGLLAAVYVCTLCLISQFYIAAKLFGLEAMTDLPRGDEPEGQPVQAMTTPLES